MFKTQASVTINRSKQHVFDYVTDPANRTRWQDSAVSAEWTTEGPPGVGSTQESVSKFMGRKTALISEVTNWDPPNSYGFRVIKGPMSFQFQGNTVLETAGESGTELTVDIEAGFGGFFKLADGLMRKRFEKQMNTDLNALKLLLEGKQK
jgi:hypothetical protein